MLIAATATLLSRSLLIGGPQPASPGDRERPPDSQSSNATLCNRAVKVCDKFATDPRIRCTKRSSLARCASRNPGFSNGLSRRTLPLKQSRNVLQALDFHRFVGIEPAADHLLERQNQAQMREAVPALEAPDAGGIRHRCGVGVDRLGQQFLGAREVAHDGPPLARSLRQSFRSMPN